MNKYAGLSVIFRNYLLVLAIFTLFRILLFLTELDRINFEEIDLITILKAFVMGLRFDLVIIGYIMALPALIILLLDILNIKSRIPVTVTFYYLLVLFPIAFIICAADIPFFNEFYSRFSITAFEWFDSPKFVFKMITQEPKYFLVAIPLFILIYLFYWRLKKLFRKFEPGTIAWPIKIATALLTLSLVFIGIRGRISKTAPIKIGTAYFCNHSFLNQLGLNPVFTLIRSYIDVSKKDNQTIHLMKPDRAFNMVRKELNIPENGNPTNIAKLIEVEPGVPQRKANVIYILMESMSAGKMTRHGCKKNLTPFLDSLTNEGLYFENHYSAGIHTYNGTFSTLFSFPALYRHRIMDQINNYNGIITELEKHGYSTTYFTTHDAQFDNTAGFLTANGFDQIVSDIDYPSKEIKTAMGVTDDFMFKYSMPILDSLHLSGKPFFTTFMTGSDHGPYYIPDYFKPHSDKIKDGAVEFADWSLRKFIERCSTKEWFDNTLFVFVADHGKSIKPRYAIPLNYCHTPLLFFAPKLIDTNKVLSKMANQTDAFPTTMGILNLPYLKNNLGINLLKENRPYAIFNFDDRVGVIDHEHFLVLRKEGGPILYRYQDTNTKNIINEYRGDKVKKMTDYIYSNMQVYQELLKKNKLFVEE